MGSRIIRNSITCSQFSSRQAYVIRMKSHWSLYHCLLHHLVTTWAKTFYETLQPTTSMLYLLVTEKISWGLY